MRTISNIKIMTVVLISALGAVSCDNNDNDNTTPVASLDFSGTYAQQDQMGRPAINTVFVASGQPKDDFNATIPSEMGAKYQSVFKTKLLALNSAYTTNALTLSADAFTGVLATDVLNVSMTKTTTFFDGTNVLTGRALGDDVIDTELLLIFGGPNGTANPGLTKDNVNKNDKEFTVAFPYLATAW
ncbi:DUF4331 family protein [Flavobacterium algicola]|uniref:DUF4331 family protein n=1 Tax=Flavobacterium algicola TaxID=556529 RepID=UPI001EFDB5AA|nr:DUF4331 family protein [Flavobacterium algicola]MCG9792449.1 DUF4331 domain-containing protein [Flavobacterium algicola]